MLHNLLHLRRIGGAARHKLAHIDPAVKLHRLRGNMIQKFASDVFHRFHSGPREAIMIQENERAPENRYKRNDEDDNGQKRKPQRFVFALHFKTEPGEKSFQLAVFPAELLRFFRNGL